MHEYISVSFSPKLKDIRQYFKEWDEARYNGDLSKGIKSGNLIWLENERILIGNKRFEQYKNWYDNFEKLLFKPGFIGANRPENLKDILLSTRSIAIYNELINLEGYEQNGFDEIIFFFNKVLKQPLFYIEAVDKFNKGLTSNQIIYHRFHFLKVKIEFARDKFYERKIGIRNNILKTIVKNPEQIKKLLKLLILFTEHFITNIYAYNQYYGFHLYKSPLMAEYMEFIQDVQCYLRFLNQNGDLPFVNEYLKNIEELKQSFEIVFQSKPISVDKKLSIVDLFRNKGNAKHVKDILEYKGFVENGKWIGNSGNKTELLAAYTVLKPLLLNGKVTPQAKIFYNEFGLRVAKNRLNKDDYITERSLRTDQLNTIDVNEFEAAFSRLLSKNS